MRRRCVPAQHPKPQYAVKVSHLPPSCSKADLECLFSPYGPIESTRLLGSREESYAYVNFSSHARAADAVQNLDNYRGLQGQTRPLRVVIKGTGMESPPQHTLKVIHLPAAMDEDDLTSICEQFGEVASVKINRKVTGNYAYINFSDQREAERALEYLNNKFSLRGQQVKASWHPQPSTPTSPLAHFSPSNSPTTQTSWPFPPGPGPSQAIKVSIHGGGITAEDLFGLFSRYGRIVGHPKIQPGCPDYAYVNFSSSTAASMACREPELRFKGVCLSVKPSAKSVPVEKGTKEISDGDTLVCLLLSKKPFFQEAQSYAQQRGATVTPKQGGGGLQLFGNQFTLDLVVQDLHTLISRIKQRLVPQIIPLHCCYLPHFAKIKVIQEFEERYLVELTITDNNGQTVDLVPFCAKVASLLKPSQSASKTDPTPLSAFKSFLPTMESGRSVATAKWSFEDNSNVMVPFDHVGSQLVEVLFQTGSNHQDPLTIGKWSYTYDFTAMMQTNTTTKRVRKIKREVPITGQDQSFSLHCRGEQENVTATIDALKKALEKETVQLELPLEHSTPAAESSLLHLASQYLVKVEVDKSVTPKITITGCAGYAESVMLLLKEKALDMKASAAALSKEKPLPPRTWEKQSRQCELKEVRQGTPEWQDVESRVMRTIPQAKIAKLERIQNEWLWERYAFCKQRMSKKNKGQVGEEWLFHGTRSTSPNQIYHSEHGFDFRYGGNGMWGTGAYFARDASYSVNSYAHTLPDGKRQILLAQVLTGDSVELPPTNSLKKPPAKPHGSGVHVNELYDSVKGSANGTRIYIVYDHDKAYPSYLITFKPATSRFTF